jgi:hypothetical protein
MRAVSDMPVLMLTACYRVEVTTRRRGLRNEATKSP